MGWPFSASVRYVCARAHVTQFLNGRSYSSSTFRNASSTCSNSNTHSVVIAHILFPSPHHITLRKWEGIDNILPIHTNKVHCLKIACNNGLTLGVMFAVVSLLGVDKIC